MPGRLRGQELRARYVGRPAAAARPPPSPLPWALLTPPVALGAWGAGPVRVGAGLHAPPPPPLLATAAEHACASNPCANGGQCLPFEASYICGCPAGFHGPTCRQDVNECSQSPGPCLNGGTCLNELGSYRCACRASHTGPHCELPYVPCSPSPCQNGGTCRPTGDTTHECTCLPGTARGRCGGARGRAGEGAGLE